MGKKSEAALEAERVHNISRDLEAAIETVRFLVGLLVQMWAILVAANALVIGYGFAEKLAGAFFVGAAISAAISIASWMAFTSVTILAFQAYVAETALGATRGLVRGFSLLISPRAESAFARLAPAGVVATARTEIWRGGWKPGMKLVLLQAFVAIAQVVLGFCLLGWAPGYTVF
ncbi:hypothetical protein QL996_13350 [Planococcus sp. APC 4015]|nr:hypothetical protein [Planococcus sp. APC 4015]